MDALITINKVVSCMGISSRTLRYWESVGLFKSTRDIQSGWRMYDDYALQLALERKKHVVSKLQGGFSMENVKSKFEEVQFVKMPPARTAAYSYVGTEPEDEAYGVVRDWINKNGLESTMRMFGFNTEPCPSSDNPAYGFGYCEIIPEGIEIPKPLYEMRLPGGIYAVIPASAYKDDPIYGWKKVHELCNDNKWEWKYDDARNPGLEEHIDRAEGGVYIPILFPVKKKV